MHPRAVVATTVIRRKFSQLSHVLWHYQYYIVWVPKYRYRVLTDKVGFEAMKTIRIYTKCLGCEIVELNVQI
jgi:putative transposase